MIGRYDLNGNLFLERDNGETIILNYSEFLELFATITDVKPVPFDRDLFCEQMGMALGLEVC